MTTSETLSEICNAMVEAMESHPEFSDKDRAVVLLIRHVDGVGESGASHLHGYEGEARPVMSALADVMQLANKIAAAAGFTLPNPSEN
jgi:demethoxyubiquinone hydroxylase (CLK1/Coq7/Cat5 family)